MNKKLGRGSLNSFGFDYAVGSDASQEEVGSDGRAERYEQSERGEVSAGASDGEESESRECTRSVERTWWTSSSMDLTARYWRMVRLGIYTS
eukprot:979700-Amorphochlora_amoeboformis.AAC.1